MAQSSSRSPPALSLRPAAVSALFAAFLIAVAMCASVFASPLTFANAEEAAAPAKVKKTANKKKPTKLTKKATAEQKPARRPTNPTAAQSEQMPDPTDPRTRKSLLCSACRAVAKGLFNIARTTADRRGLRAGRLPDALDWAEAFDGACAAIAARNGLLMINNVATTTYSDVTEVSIMRGVWITSLLEDKCAEWLEAIEAKVTAYYAAFGSHYEMQPIMCGDGTTASAKAAWVRGACGNATDVALHEKNTAPFVDGWGQPRPYADVSAAGRIVEEADADKAKKEKNLP